MGYAEASGLPPIKGLYATIIPLIVFALMLLFVPNLVQTCPPRPWPLWSSRRR